MKHKFVSLWIIFLLYFFCYMGVEISMWVPLGIWSAGLATYLLIKNKLPSKKYIVISVAFAVLVSVAYLGLNMGVGVVLFNAIRVGIPTLLCSLAVFSVMENHDGYQMVSSRNKNSSLVSVIIAVIAGVILSVINTFLGVLSGSEIAFEFSIMKLLVCLNPAIFEEMACRAIFMAYCIYFAGNDKMNGFGKFTMYFMMCMPHTFAHGYPLSATLILCVLFGIPFTILQRKRDIASAMISHGLVDAVAFTLTGL